ncbi:hypothetical protein FPV16_19195 [Methylobacterium sp. W2]|uniref:hypothetical protein n=1 Tax=Methylobacterium sp. W2 TaxID=2598107 RepID=UPI001D0C3DED|nr:hypothetical protein [Methylobacterium sp. W2]MCC0808309.1 hypothetical protein [Methylobacterium sp. W2]
MPDGSDTFELRYVGARFDGGHLPLDVLPDLFAFRDLIIARAKEQWLRENPGRLRLPRGFNHSLLFDLVGITDESAGPQIKWDRDAAARGSPELANEIGTLLEQAYAETALLFSGAAQGRFPNVLPRDQLHALNRFGSALRPGEKIELKGQNDNRGEVIYVDFDRRKNLLTKVGETYTQRYAGSGTLVTTSSDGFIALDTNELGRIILTIPSEIVLEHYDGNLGSDVQFDLMIVLDVSDKFRAVQECLDVTIVDASDDQEFRDAMTRIAELRKLEKGWLDGDGEAISQGAIKTARAVLHRRPDIAKLRLGIFPTEEGGLTFEFHRDGWNHALEMMPANAVEWFATERGGPDSIEPTLFQISDQAFWDQLDGRIGRFSKDG